MLMHSCTLCKIVGALAIIGALNWGLIGLFGVNVVDHLFGAGSLAERVTYIVIGLSGLALLTSYFTACPCCKKE